MVLKAATGIFLFYVQKVFVCVYVFWLFKTFLISFANKSLTINCFFFFYYLIDALRTIGCSNVLDLGSYVYGVKDCYGF